MHETTVTIPDKFYWINYDPDWRAKNMQRHKIKKTAWARDGLTQKDLTSIFCLCAMYYSKSFALLGAIGL
jgi:hypothetical protein